MCKGNLHKFGSLRRVYGDIGVCGTTGHLRGLVDRTEYPYESFHTGMLGLVELVGRKLRLIGGRDGALRPARGIRGIGFTLLIVYAKSLFAACMNLVDTVKYK